MDDESLQSLLARGGLSGAQRDRILERVLAQRATPKPSRKRWLIAASVALPLAAGVALMVVARSGADSRGEGYIAPKGGSGGASLEARCPGRAPNECRAGDRLIFEVGGTRAPAYFAGYAVCGAGERIWYFPDAAGASPLVVAGDEHRVLTSAARIGPEHGAGRCTLHLSLHARPVDREALASGAAHPATSVTQTLTILP